MNKSSNSIKLKLIRNLSVSLSILLMVVLFACDRGIDNWIETEFDRTLQTKAGLLITLVDEDLEGIELEFADEFMPEFSKGTNIEYFQFWLDGKPFEQSESFKRFDQNHFHYEPIPINEHKVSKIVLPDGRPGKIFIQSFFPQVDSEIRNSPNFPANFLSNQKPMQLAYAASTEELDQTLFLVDSFFLLTLVISILLVNITVRLIIKHELETLNELNAQIKEIKLNSQKKFITLSSIPSELNEIVKSINNFIIEKLKLLDKQKRVTSDIAHELKTPISELINLTEVAIRFPNDKDISSRYHSDILGISLRMKNLVNDIMLLQLSESKKELSIERLDIIEAVDTIIKKHNESNDRIRLSTNTSSIFIQTNKFALETILNNVINNALFYSPEKSLISIEISNIQPNQQMVFKITNKSTQELNEEDIENLFEPLWQKDSSRTANDRFGLGLSIVKSFCQTLNVLIDVKLEDKNMFILSLTFASEFNSS